MRVVRRGIGALLVGALMVLSGCDAGDARRVAESAPEPTTAATAAIATAVRDPAHVATPEATVPPANETVTPTPAPTAPPTPVVVATPTIAPAPVFAAPPTPNTTVIAPSLSASASARVVYRGPTDRNFIALSFDAGSDAGYTAQILDTLRERGVRASFGITGRWAEQNPDLMRRIVADGHHLINHTYNHDSFTGLSTRRGPISPAARAEQLAKTEAVVRSIAGAEFGPYFRPPYGDFDASVNADVGAHGYAYNVMWTVDSLGWNGLPARGIIDRCLEGAVPGAIYIFHVGGQSQDGPALPAVIDGLRARGYALGTVAELIEG
jgi:peptidoglycan/xylan/chitin deacetylase (PgdA/CDA1 family)